METLRQSGILERLSKEWRNLAECLNLDASLVMKLQRDVITKKQTTEEVLADILLDWKIRDEENVTITLLIDTMKNKCFMHNLVGKY